MAREVHPTTLCYDNAYIERLLPFVMASLIVDNMAASVVAVEGDSIFFCGSS